MRGTQLGELQSAIMRILWKHDASVAQLREELKPSHEVATTTVATVLARLERRGAVARYSEGGVYVYRALATQRQVRSSMVRVLLDRLFNGNPSALLHHLVREEDVDMDELAHFAKRLEEQRDRQS